MSFAFYKPVFMAELLIVEYLFTCRLRKRRYFLLRYAVTVALCMAAAIAIPFHPQNSVSLSCIFLGFFAVTYLLHLLCFDVSALNLLFCLITAYTVHHFAYCLSNGMLLLTGLNEDIYGIYAEEAAQQQLSANFVFGSIFSLVIFYLSCYVFFLLFGNRIKKNQELRLKNTSLLIISALSIVLSIFVNAMVVYGDAGDDLKIAINIYNALCCCFIIYMLFSMLSNVTMEDELNTVNKILRESREQYEISKKNIELINVKCHDLKHQIREIGQASHLNEAAIAEIEDVISIYDSEVKTGNIALDTILTEKSLYCYKNAIRLTCIADGSLLGFMSEAELYGMFGNAVDNAIAAVKMIEQEDKRTIGLSVRREGDFVAVNVHNYFEGELRYSERGLPFTTKKDKENHGFGLKSIAYIVEKYGGTLSVNTKGGVFNLNVIFPI